MTARHLQAVPDPDGDADDSGMTPTSKPKRRRRYVRKRKDGTRAYPVRYAKPDGTTGQLTFDTAEAADAFRREQRARRRGGQAADLSTTIDEHAKKWARSYVAGQEDKTIAMHVGNLTNRMLPWAGGMRVVEWSRQTTKDYIAWIGRAGDVRKCRQPDGRPYGRWDEVPVDHPDRRPAGAATVRQAVQTGSLLMWEAMDQGLRTDNPFVRAKRPAEKPAPKRALTVVELELIGLACDALGKTTAKALIVVRAFTGMRMQDARALEWRDVDLKAGWIVVRRAADHQGKIKSTKSGKEDDGRRVPLRGLALELLREFHDAQPVRRGLVFRSATGGMIDASNFREREWLPILAVAARGLRWELAADGVDEADIDERVDLLLGTKMHELRHTMPALVREMARRAGQTIPRGVAMSWGGWRSPKMWARYDHLWDEELERAADALGPVD